jgi:hypothetical protein
MTFFKSVKENPANFSIKSYITWRTLQENSLAFLQKATLNQALPLRWDLVLSWWWMYIYSCRMDYVSVFCSVTTISEGALQVTQLTEAVDSFETLVTITKLLSHVAQKATLQPRRFTSLLCNLHIVNILLISIYVFHISCGLCRKKYWLFCSFGRVIFYFQNRNIHRPKILKVCIL